MKTRKKMKIKKSKLYFIVFSMIISSCRDNNLAGEYKIDKIVGDTVFQNYIKQIRLLPNNVITIKSKNKLLTGKWVDKQGTDFHIIEVKVNGKFKQMQVYEHALNDPSIKLYFVGDPTDFQGGYYDSLSFIKVK